MKKFDAVKGLVLPLDRANVDTDFIIPKQFLKSIKRTGFGVNLFDEHRYLDKGEPDADNSKRPINEDFVLNKVRYANARILLTRENFGCGSSREHAVWALVEYGIRCVVAPSFADIFKNNAYKSGLLPVELDEAVINALFDQLNEGQVLSLTVNLEAEQVVLPDGSSATFSVDPFRRQCLLEGLDDIGITLQRESAISAFETKHRQARPWLFSEIKV